MKLADVDARAARRRGGRARPPASSVARAIAVRRPRARARPRRVDGGGAPSQQRTARRASTGGSARERAPRSAPSAPGHAAHRELVEVLGLCTEDVGLAREHRDEVAPGAALDEHAAAPRGGPRRAGTRGRRSSGRRAPSTPSASQSARVSARRSPSSGRTTCRVPRRHAREPGRGRAAQQVEQHGLGLVVGGVADEHDVGARARRRARSSAAYRASRAARLEVARPGSTSPTARTEPGAELRRDRARRASASRALPGRRPWSTCTATGASPASAASASSATESAPPEHATTTGAVDARHVARRTARATVRGRPPRRGGRVTSAPSTRASQSAGRASSSRVGRHSGPRHAASIARGPASRSTAATNASPTSYWRIFDSSPTSFCRNAAMPALWRRACSTRAMRACPATCSRPSWFITRLPWPSSSDISACTLAERAALLVAGEQRDEAAVVERVAAAAQLVGRARERLHEPPRIGVDRRQRALDQREVVGLHPRHAGELRPVRDLVDRDPEPEVARPEREALLQREDVAADVVDGVGRGVVVVEHEQVVLAEHALREVARAARRSRCRRPAGRSGATRLRAMRSPTRAVSGSSRRRIDATLARHPRRRGRRPAARAGPGATQPGVVGDERLGLGGDLVEVVAQRPGEVRGGERLAPG